MARVAGVPTFLRGMASALAFVLVALVTAHGCELERIEPGCGNGVVEVGRQEGCDNEGPGCGQPNEMFACQHICAGASEYGCDSACPVGMSYGVDAL